MREYLLTHSIRAGGHGSPGLDSRLLWLLSIIMRESLECRKHKEMDSYFVYCFAPNEATGFIFGI
jgi:hypothetical protein